MGVGAPGGSKTPLTSQRGECIANCSFPACYDDVSCMHSLCDSSLSMELPAAPWYDAFSTSNCEKQKDSNLSQNAKAKNFSKKGSVSQPTSNLGKCRNSNLHSPLPFGFQRVVSKRVNSVQENKIPKSNFEKEKIKVENYWEKLRNAYLVDEKENKDVYICDCKERNVCESRKKCFHCSMPCVCIGSWHAAQP